MFDEAPSGIDSGRKAEEKAEDETAVAAAKVAAAAVAVAEAAATAETDNWKMSEKFLRKESKGKFFFSSKRDSDDGKFTFPLLSP